LSFSQGLARSDWGGLTKRDNDLIKENINLIKKEEKSHEIWLENTYFLHKTK